MDHAIAARSGENARATFIRRTYGHLAGAILGFVALIVGCSLGIAFGLRAAGVSYPATIGCGVGGLVMGLGGPVLNRQLRRIMLGNRAGIR